MMNLVRESKEKGINESEIWKILLKHRWDSEILKINPCLDENNIAKVIFKTGQDLRLNYDWNIWITKRDIRLEIELFSAVHFCPDSLIEFLKVNLQYIAAKFRKFGFFSGNCSIRH